MNRTAWILLDIETTGFIAPIFAVEIGAQRMFEWESVGEPFRKLLNQNQDIPAEVSRGHGYTREILERDGESAAVVYSAFREYAEGLPLVSYNVEFDLQQVLKPEWMRLGIPPVGSAGFCALRLSQRLLDPVPAGNCKLQTLRQYYRLPERGAHTALGDVQTVADLFAQVLRPIAEQRGLETWAAIQAYASEEWYPSRLAFGKHKGKSVWDARENREFREWLEWLARSSNARNGRIHAELFDDDIFEEWLARSSNARNGSMGRWYLRQLQVDEPELPFVSPAAPTQNAEGPGAFRDTERAIVLYEHPDLQRLQVLVDVARGRLAELEAAYTFEKSKVDRLQARLFQHLRAESQSRDLLRLLVKYRRHYLDVLLRQGEDEAEGVGREYEQAKARTEREYEEADKALAAKKELGAEDQEELGRLWKNLVKLYHPDRFRNEADKLETYEKLTAAINHAKDSGDIGTLRQIAGDPQGFILRQGWAGLDFREEEQAARLRKLWESLELEIVSVIEATNRLRESPEFELLGLTAKEPALFDRVVAKQKAQLETEIATLRGEAEGLEKEIAGLTGREGACGG